MPTSFQVSSVIIVSSAVGGVGYGIYDGSKMSEYMKDKKIEELLKSANLTVLNTNESESTNDTDWKEVLKDYVTSTKHKFIGEVKETEKESQDTLKKIKAKCKEIIDKYFDLNKIFNYWAAQRWCIKKTKIADVLDKEAAKITKSPEDSIHWANSLKKLAYNGFRRGGKLEWKELDLKSECSENTNKYTTEIDGFIETKNFLNEYCMKPKASNTTN